MKNRVVKLRSKATTPNPKDVVGATKVSISKFPVVAILHGAMAMMDGAAKYDPYNWRAENVQAHIYVDAAMRHLFAWWEGEELAKDSKTHHLGHAVACLAILLDAQHSGNLIDDRPIQRDGDGQPIDPEWLARVMDEMREKIKGKGQSF